MLSKKFLFIGLALCVVGVVFALTNGTQTAWKGVRISSFWNDQLGTNTVWTTREQGTPNRWNQRCGSANVSIERIEEKLKADFVEVLPLASSLFFDEVRGGSLKRCGELVPSLAAQGAPSRLFVSTDPRKPRLTVAVLFLDRRATILALRFEMVPDGLGR